MYLVHSHLATMQTIVLIAISATPKLQRGGSPHTGLIARVAMQMISNPARTKNTKSRMKYFTAWMNCVIVLDRVIFIQIQV
jgi:hypothetical protein